jgi:subtilisin family serine protease
MPPEFNPARAGEETTTMHTHHAWNRALVGCVLALAAWTSAAEAAWMWDQNQDGIDDRIVAVEQNGLTTAHVGATLSGRLRFAVFGSGAPFEYGVYVAYDHAPTPADSASLAGLGVPVHRYRYIPYVRTRASFAQILQIASLPGVSRVESIPIMYPVNDVASQVLRGRASGNALFPNVWTNLGFTGEGVVVAILDTGANDADNGGGYPGHESLRGKFLGGGNFYAGDPLVNTPLDASENPQHAFDPEATYHGTHVAGTAIGSGGPEGLLNGAAPGFYAGIAPNARLVDCKALSDAGLGFGAADALDWLIHNRFNSWGLTGADTVYRGIDVANLSLGGTDPSDGTDGSSAAVNAAHKAGIIVCVATGNDGNTNHMSSPAAADFAVSVGSFTDNNTVARGDDIVADYSNEGPRASDGDTDQLDEMKPNVMGSGTGILSAFGDVSSDGRQYHHINGTSMACPSVAGVAALLLSANPTLTSDEARRILMDTAEHRTAGGKQPAGASDPFNIDPNYHPSWGWGQADAYAAIKEALSPSGTQVVRIRTTPQRGPDGIVVDWWSQREVGLVRYEIDRAPDVAGGPGAWTNITQVPVASPSTQIHAVTNRHAYSYTDLDPSLVTDALYWYRVRWVDVNGYAHSEPALSGRIMDSPVLARIEYSWTHNWSDGDLAVRFGTGTDTGNPVWFRPGEGAPAADSIVNVGGVNYLGTLRHYFHVDLTAEDGIGTYLPPGPANPWFLSVKEGGFINTLGKTDHFKITVFNGGGSTEYVSPQTTTPHVEKTETVFWIPLDPVTTLNHAPVLMPIGNRTVGEGLALQFFVSATDADGDGLTYSATGLPPGATFNPVTKLFSWTPGYTDAGTYPVHFAVVDDQLLPESDSEDIVITVTERNPGDNDPPLLDPMTDRYGVAGESMAFKVTGRDPEGGALAYSASGLPSGATLNSGSGMFVWTPGLAQVGSHAVTFMATDTGALSDSASILLIVGQPGSGPPPPLACDALPQATIYGNIGMGIDPGPKSEVEHAFYIPQGTQSIQGSLFWFLPARDLDFFLLDQNHNVVNSSASLSDPEVITLTNPTEGTYYWKIVAFTNPDTTDYSIASSMCVSPNVDVIPTASLRVFSLAPSMPNPFRQQTTVGFTIPKSGITELKIYDVSGRAVRTLQSGWLPAGAHRAIWDRSTDRGRMTAAGVYFYRLSNGGETLSRMVVVMP